MLRHSSFQWFQTILASVVTVAAVGCGGGGCSSGCAGSSVIPKGFPKAERVQNAAGVRLTRPGLDFLEANLGPILQKVLSGGGGAIKDGVMSFDIPESNGKVLSIFSYTVCPGGPDPAASPPKCVVEIHISDIRNIKIKSITPHNIIVNADIPVRLRNLPIKAIGISMTAGLGKGSAGDCAALDYVPVPVTADISLENIPDDALHAARAGYTRIRINKVDFDQKTIENNFMFCGSGIGTSILNALKGLIIGSVIGGLSGQLTGPLANATCMKEQVLPDGTKQCPDATFNRSGTCRYADKDDAECVPMLLGIESRFDLSGLLASLSPGTSGGLDFMLASGGDMQPAPGADPLTNGITLTMFGGAIPQPISTCVPKADETIPTGLDIPDELKINDIKPWPAAPFPAPHIGFALAEKHLNHIAIGAYNSGLFCIGISSEQVPQLDAGLFSLLLNSVKQISDTFDPGSTHPSMALAIRPQKAPKIVIGDGADFVKPLLDINMKDTDLDFYMWSHDRFIRMFTGRIDIRIPMNMEAGKDGIALKFADKDKDKQPPLQFTNPRVSNNNILLEDDKQVGKLVESIGGLIPSSALGNIKPFKLDSALAGYGLKLSIPKEGIRKLTKGTEAYLGIFGSLELAGAAMPTTKTTAKVTRVAIEPKNYQLATVGESPTEVSVHADSDLDNGTRVVEYAYKVDGGPWSTFSTGRDFNVHSPFFMLQGHHKVFVTSRVANMVESEGEAVALPVLIDTLAPMVKVQNVAAGTVKILATDLVSDAQNLKVDARIDGGAWFPVDLGEFKPAAGKHTSIDRVVSVPITGIELEVRATDEAGNVASSSSRLIRGRADGSVAGKGGCGCAVPGASSDRSGTGVAMIGGLALLGAVLERRRRRGNRARELACASMLVGAVGSSGCVCANGDTQDTPPDDRPPVVSYVLGSYTSAQPGKDGKIWVAGYNEGDPAGGTSDDFQGDLVVGKLDPANNTIDWQVIDGVPDVAPTHNKNGFRRGVTDPGDDVGLYTAMAVDAAGNPTIAYFDRTNGALRIARNGGGAWTTYELERGDKGWAGKFNSMVNAGGKLALAYQTLEPGTGGWAKAKVKVARASSDSPDSADGWTKQDVVVDDKTPCVQAICNTGEKCLVGDKSTTPPIDPVCMATTAGCEATCTDACVKIAGKPTCTKARATLGGYVNAIGLFNSLSATAAGDLGLVFYDRLHGNLRGAKNSSGTWVSTPATAPIDGWVGDAAKDKGLGDRGIGATLAIDESGNWHIAYVDGIKEWLLYKFIAAGDFTKPVAPIIVDDGNTADGSAASAFKDGNHVIGENAHLVVDAGTVKIVYQPSTAGTLRWAKAPGGAAAKFNRGVIKQDGFAGFFPRIVGSSVVNFFRMKGTTIVDDAGTAGDPLILGNVRALPLP